MLRERDSRILEKFFKSNFYRGIENVLSSTQYMQQFLLVQKHKCAKLLMIQVFEFKF